MTLLNAQQPIGIFDSGVGGLTVAHQVAQLLPQERLIYFGDVAHHPYGEKSVAALQAYAIKICDMLLQQNCKVILIACHTASATAYELVKEYVASKALVVNVIDPVMDYLREHFAGKHIGVIGTRQTIQSNIYQRKVDALQRQITLRSVATPLLAPMIEEGYANHPALAQTLTDYLSHPALADIEALLLGCTHYPLIKKQILECFNRPITLIDSAEITAHALRGLLEHHHLLNRQSAPTHRFYVSDYTESFVESARYFFPTTLSFEKYPLWE